MPASPTAPTDADRQALTRCRECFEDGQDTDVGRPALDRLTALGWLDKIGRARWQISDEGEAVLAAMTEQTTPEAAPTLAFAFHLGGAPGFWLHETGGVLRPAVKAFLAGAPLTDPQIAAIRAYCRQWIFAPGFIGDEVEDLRARVDGLTTQAAIEDWMLDATAACVDPL